MIVDRELDPPDCPFCRGDYPDDLVEKLKSATFSDPMSAEDFLLWLAALKDAENGS